MEQIFIPFQDNKNKILLSTTPECSYLLLLLHSIYYVFTIYVWIFFIILHIEENTVLSKPMEIPLYYIAIQLYTNSSNFSTKTFINQFE